MAVIVVYGGGFQPFHAGHLSSYVEAKQQFPDADFYVAASNDTKTRPIPFKDKQFLAQQAGVIDKFTEVKLPIRPTEILDRYNPNKDIFILVRSERDPVGYTKKDGSPGYYQPFVSIANCQPFGHNGYVFVTHKKEFKLNGQVVYSGTQVRDMYAGADERGRQIIVKQLYPQSKQQGTIKQMLDKYIGAVAEPIEKPVKGAINKLRANKLKEQIQRMRPLIREATIKQKYKFLKLMKEATQLDELNLFRRKEEPIKSEPRNSPNDYRAYFTKQTKPAQKVYRSPDEYYANTKIDPLKAKEPVKEGPTSDMRDFFKTQQPLNTAPIKPGNIGPTIATVTRQGESMAEVTTRDELEELANTSLKVKEPKDFVNVNDRKQVTYKVMKFKSGKDIYLINFTVKGPPAFGKKQNWNAVNVSFGVREEQDDYSFGDEINTDLTAKNKKQFLIYSTVINAIRKFITEYNTEIDEIIMQGAGERQAMMYQRFFRVAPKYFPGWHYDGKHSLVRDVPRQTGKKVREQGMAEGLGDQGNFADDTPVDIGGDTVKRLGIGDIVSYLGQKSKIVAQSKNRKYSRITIASDFGGTTKDVLTSDLKRLGQDVAEDRENFNGINLLLQKDDEEVFVKASAGGRELGHVLFVMDGDYLMPQDLEVEERYRGQGIAQTMYDFVKSKGYKIRRSGQQTDAGAGFWAKHRPEQNVWEEGVAESNDYLEEK